MAFLGLSFSAKTFQFPPKISQYSCFQCSFLWGLTEYRVSTCLENLEMSGNLTDVREMSGILLKIQRNVRENLVREKLPKTVYCKLHIRDDTGIQYQYGHDVTFNIPNAVNCQGISHCLQSGQPVNILAVLFYYLFMIVPLLWHSVLIIFYCH